MGSWSFALGATISGPAADVAPRLRGFDLVVVDGQDASAELVAALRAQGTVVLGYLDVGVIEPNRPWTAGARPYRLDRRQPGDEWYADVAHPGFRTLVTTTMLPPVLARGFDGVFLDHVDMIDSHPAQRDAMVDLVREVSGRVHDRGGVLFAQNGADATIEAVAPFLDGWNRDGVSSTYDAATSAYAAVPVEARQVALATVERLRARNLLVTTIDHLPDPASADAVAARQRACQAGAVPTIGDGGLTLIFPPSRC